MLKEVFIHKYRLFVQKHPYFIAETQLEFGFYIFFGHNFGFEPNHFPAFVATKFSGQIDESSPFGLDAVGKLFRLGLVAQISLAAGR